MERLEPDVRRELGRFGSPGSIGRIVEEWPAAVGEAIARNAWPARVARDGTLHVATSSSAWAFELAQLAPTILDRLRDKTGEEAPKAIRFAPGPVPEPPVAEPSEPGSVPPPPSPHVRAEAERIAAAVGDEDLRRLVARAAAASLSQGVGGRPI